MMKCGFNEGKDCTEKCKYFNTCTRNQHGYKRKVDKNGRKKNVHQESDR